MSDPLSANNLMKYVRVLADEIGPRPAGHPQEAQARLYIRQELERSGFTDIEEMPLTTWDTWSYNLLGPALLALSGSLLGRLGRLSKLAGGLTSLAGAYFLWQTTAGLRTPLDALYSKLPTANLVARIPARAARRQTVVLIGHTDSNKHRPSFSDGRKSQIQASITTGIALAALAGLAQLAQFSAPKGRRAPAAALQTASTLGLAAMLPLVMSDDLEGYIDGANDNASAVACLLGLGAHLKQNPLQHTEVWLAFTAAEEVGLLGTYALVDAYGVALKDAWFIDFEMVGTPDIAYVTRHSSLSYLGAYEPDGDSLALAEAASRAHPELGVHGRAMMINEEVAALRQNGLRGLCLVGVGEDGWLANWHQYSDNTANLDPSGLEKAARFALYMMEHLDRMEVR